MTEFSIPFFNGQLLPIGFSVIAMLYAWFCSRHKDIDRRFKENEERITELEKQISNLPNLEKVHQLALIIEKLTGKLETLGAQMKGQTQVLERIEKTVGRHEDHLLATAGGEK